MLTSIDGSSSICCAKLSATDKARTLSDEKLEMVYVSGSLFENRRFQSDQFYSDGSAVAPPTDSVYICFSRISDE
jgi:hypothetical protein